MLTMLSAAAHSARLYVTTFELHPNRLLPWSTTNALEAPKRVAYFPTMFCARPQGAVDGDRSLLGLDPKGGGLLYGPQTCRTEQCALSVAEAPEIFF